MSKVQNYSCKNTYPENRDENKNEGISQKQIDKKVAETLSNQKQQDFRNAKIQKIEFIDLPQKNNSSNRKQFREKEFEMDNIICIKMEVQNDMNIIQSLVSNIENINAEPRLVIPIIEVNTLRRYIDENLELLEIQSVSSMNEFAKIQKNPSETVCQKQDHNLKNKINLRQLNQYQQKGIAQKQSGIFFQQEDFYNFDHLKIDEATEQEQVDYQSKSQQEPKNKQCRQCDFQKVQEVQYRTRSKTTQVQKSKINFQELDLEEQRDNKIQVSQQLQKIEPL